MKKPSSESVPIRPKSGQEQYCNVQYHSFPQSLVLTAELFSFWHETAIALFRKGSEIHSVLQNISRHCNILYLYRATPKLDLQKIR